MEMEMAPFPSYIERNVTPGHDSYVEWNITPGRDSYVERNVTHDCIILLAPPPILCPPHLCITPGGPVPAADQGSQHALRLALLQRGPGGREQRAPHVQLQKVGHAAGGQGLEGAGGGLQLREKWPWRRLCCWLYCDGGQAGHFAWRAAPRPAGILPASQVLSTRVPGSCCC